MKLRTASLAAALAALLAATPTAPARAQINIGWDDCGAAGAEVKAWACDANPDVVARFHVSFVITPSTTLTSLTGAQCDIRLMTDGSPIPPWWQAVTTGSCRPGTSALRVSYTAPCASATDYFSTRGVLGGFAYDWGLPNMAPDVARLRTVQAVVPSTLASPVGPGEYSLLTVTLGGANTVGLGACSGCQKPMAMLVNSIMLTQPVGIGDQWLVRESTRQWIEWQCGGWPNSCSPGFVFYNCATPARAPSWGQIKALYR